MVTFVFVGPESSGKTTLCKKVAEHFGTSCIPEMCRIMAEERPQTSNEINFHFTFNDFVEMAKRHDEEECLRSQAKPFLICDNDSIAVSIWCERYLGVPSIKMHDFYKNSNLHDKVYILTKPNVPFVQDGYRDGEDIRDWMYDRFILQLNDHELKYFIIDSPDYEERFTAAMTIIKTNM